VYFGRLEILKILGESVAHVDNQETVLWHEQEAVQVAATFKRFFKVLPDPLLTFGLYQLFLTSYTIKDESKRHHLLRLICSLLPQAHRDCLEVLSSFVAYVAGFSQVDEESAWLWKPCRGFCSKYTLA
jgi:hypothetical protein